MIYLVSETTVTDDVRYKMGLFDEETDPITQPDDKNRLFETQQEITGFNRHYLKLLLIVAVFVIVAGSIIYYITLPGLGDQVLGPKGLEENVRSYFLDAQKRTATDITFFYCGGYYSAKVDVEARYDIPGNPQASIPTFWAKAEPRDGGAWEISVPSDQTGYSEADPCKAK